MNWNIWIFTLSLSHAFLTSLNLSWRILSNLSFSCESSPIQRSLNLLPSLSLFFLSSSNNGCFSAIAVTVFTFYYSSSDYMIGVWSYDITGPASDVNMMGYANSDQIASSIHFRLRARAFIVADPQGNRIVFVNLDACMASQIVTIKVLERLKARYRSILFGP